MGGRFREEMNVKQWELIGRAAAGILAAVIVSGCSGGIEESYPFLPAAGGEIGLDGRMCLMAEKRAVANEEWLILQNPELPNGCEVTSLAMALAAAGYPADKTVLFAGYMPSAPFAVIDGVRYGPDPSAAYAGDAASARGGWYCFEGPVIEAGNRWLAEQGADCHMERCTGLTEAALEGFLRRGIPLVVWVTRGYAPPEYADYFGWTLPDGSRYTPYNNLHCVLLAGEEGEGYRIADPLEGWQTVDKAVFWESFEAMGRLAVRVSAGGIDRA